MGVHRFPRRDQAGRGDGPGVGDRRGLVRSDLLAGRADGRRVPAQHGAAAPARVEQGRREGRTLARPARHGGRRRIGRTWLPKAELPIVEPGWAHGNAVRSANSVRAGTRLMPVGRCPYPRLTGLDGRGGHLAGLPRPAPGDQGHCPRRLRRAPARPPRPRQGTERTCGCRPRGVGSRRAGPIRRSGLRCRRRLPRGAGEGEQAATRRASSLPRRQRR